MSAGTCCVSWVDELLLCLSRFLKLPSSSLGATLALCDSGQTSTYRAVSKRHVPSRQDSSSSVILR